MSLGIKLVQAVQKETAMKRPLPLQATVNDRLHGNGRRSTSITASVTLSDNDRFSHLAEDVTVTVTRIAEGTSAEEMPRSRSKPSLEEKAQRFVQRATYLVESLQFVEMDAGGSAILRSSPETMRAPRSEYFEATVDVDALTLKRFQPHATEPGREQIPFCITDEVLARLVEDAAAVLAPQSQK